MYHYYKQSHPYCVINTGDIVTLLQTKPSLLCQVTGVVKFDTGDNVTLLQTKPSLLCHNDVVKFDTGDNVPLLQTKPSLLCHQHRGQCNITTNKAILPVSSTQWTMYNVTLLQTKPSLLCRVTGGVMMW
jgi:hypothetical protein